MSVDGNMKCHCRSEFNGDMGRLCSVHWIFQCYSVCRRRGRGRRWFGLRHWEVNLRWWGSHLFVVVHNLNARM